MNQTPQLSTSLQNLASSDNSGADAEVRAPAISTDCASSDGQKPARRQLCWRDSCRKNGFMAALLGKMVKSKTKSPQPSNPPEIDVVSPSGDTPINQLRETMASPANPVPTGDASANPRPSAFMYAPGAKPLSQYTIRCGVGMGGFGEVYFALSEAGKEVALKRIQRNLEIELRGASHCLNLKHPNLVALFDICRDEADQAWVVMEYVNGPNLRQVLDQSPDGLSEAEVRRWFSGIAAGVNHLHSAGLVHRDLKPGNVFDDMGVVKVGDYGLSKFISASHRGGHTESVGTFHYMAPEIGRGQYGREIDVYALGILLYELLTGQVPFDGESCHEIIVKHLTAMPDLSDIAQPYRSVIASALHKDPTKRPATVADMMVALGLAEQASIQPMISGLSVMGPSAVAPSALNTAVLNTAPGFDEPVLATLVSEPVARFDGSPGHYAPQQNAAATKRVSQGEPLARAVGASCGELVKFWRTLDRSPGTKKVLVILGVVALLLNTHWLLPVLSIVGIFYVPYYIIRQMVLQVRQQPTYAEAQRIATAAGVPGRPVTKDQWRDYMRNDLRAKRSIHRLAELSTSWVAATLTVVAMAIIAGVFGLRTGDVDAFSLAPFGWMAMIVLIGSLSILGMGKLWERDEGEALPRRLVMAGVGAGVGVAAFMLNETLMLPIGEWMSRDINATNLPQALYDGGGQPRASAMMAHFALLFAAVRWWKPVDPLRKTRLSLWSVAVTVVAAWGVHQILPIPQPYGMMMAGGIAIAVQMSAPWIDPRARKKAASSQTAPVQTPPVQTPQYRDGGQVV